MISEIFRFIDLEDFKQPFPAAYLAELVNLIEGGNINISTSKKIIEEMIQSTKSPKEIVKEKGLEQISDPEVIAKLVDEAIANNQKAVEEYRAGKEKALQAVVGYIMRETRGKANPQLVNQMLLERVKN